MSAQQLASTDFETALSPKPASTSQSMANPKVDDSFDSRPTVSDATRRILNRLWFGGLDLACFAAVAGTINLLFPILSFGELATLGCVLAVSNSIVGLHCGASWNSISEARLSTLVVSILSLSVSAAKLIETPTLATAGALFALWTLLVLSLPITRAALRGLLSRTSWWPSPAIVFGDGELALNVFRKLKSRPSLGLKPVCIFEEAERESIDALIKSSRISWFVFAADENRADLRELASFVSQRVPNSLVIQNALTLPSQQTSVFETVGISGIQYKGLFASRWLLTVKRTFDLAVALAITLALSPVFIALYALVRFTSKGPVFYGQERIGKEGSVFRAWKFRTMVPNADQVLETYLQENESMRREWEADHKLKNDPRVTWIGRFLRKTSLDELPQIWNVLTGEMSLVGPRPIVEAEAEKYGQDFDLYLRVTPGITGLWQVSGRNNTTYDERVELDSYYVRNWSLWLDMCILVVTVRVVLLREGAY